MLAISIKPYLISTPFITCKLHPGILGDKVVQLCLYASALKTINKTYSLTLDIALYICSLNISPQLSPIPMYSTVVSNQTIFLDMMKASPLSSEGWKVVGQIGIR